MDASGRFEAINSRGGVQLRVWRGRSRCPIGRCALATRSCVSTLANHSFWLIVGKSATLHAHCHIAQNAHALSLSLSRARALLSLSPWNSSEQDAAGGPCPWIFIVPAGSNSASTSSPSGYTNWRENAIITIQPSHESKNKIVIKSKNYASRKERKDR